MADDGRRIIHIGRQKDEERVLVGLAEMKEEVASHYEKLFTKEKCQRPLLDGVVFPSI